MLDEWYVLEDCGSQERNTNCRMADIKRKPGENRLEKMKMRAKKLASEL